MTTEETNQQITSAHLLTALLQLTPADQHKQVTLRFERHAPLLLQRLNSLYGSCPAYSGWLTDLMNTLGQLLAQRSSELRALDQQRVQQPDWFLNQNNLGYCAYVDRLGSTFNGVQNRISHLQELGVTYLHLLPFLRARDGENDGGFAVTSFAETEPVLGSMQDLSTLSAALRQAGISLCSDFILNHVADSHAWAIAARRGDAAFRDFFYTFADRRQTDAYEVSLNQVFPEAAPGNFTFDPTLQRWVWTTFYPYQWDLNYTNPQVFAAMTAAMLSLANQGVEVFRLDSTAYIWKRAGTDCMNQPEVHWILQAMRSIVDIVAPGVLLKAEAIVPTSELPSYLGGAAPECHLAYHSTLMAAGWTCLANQKVDLLRKVIKATPDNGGPASWLTYVRCHDDIGWNVLLPEANQDHQNGAQLLATTAQLLTGAQGGFGRGVNFQTSTPGKVHGTNGMSAALTGLAGASDGQALQHALNRLTLLYGLACSFGGMPMIYMGDELAQDNDTAYLNDPMRSKDSRWLQRPFLDQTALHRCHDAATKEGKVYAALQRLIQIRKQLPELAANAQRTVLDSGDDSVLAFARGAYQRGQVSDLCTIFVGNFSEHSITLDMAAITGTSLQTRWINLLDEQTSQAQISLPPWSQCWLKSVERSLP